MKDHNRNPKRRTRELVYLGWQGNDNFGDELLWESWKVALGRDLSHTAPLTLGRYAVKEATRYFQQLLHLRGSERLILLGGGTTVGFGTWARHTKLAVRMYRASGVLIPGAGASASDDAFLLDKQPADWPAWRAQKDIALMGVRGPITAEQCVGQWRATEVIGDPALLYPLYAALSLPEKRANTIGLCLGSDKTTRFDLHVVIRAVKEAARSRDAEVIIFQIADNDRDVADETRAAFGPNTRIVRYTGDTAAMATEIANCGVFISERLHGAVAAVSMGVPTVPLSYASKCDDFWMSVTGHKAPITVGHSATDLMDAIERSTDETHLADIAQSVADLQSRLEKAASVIRDWLAGEIDTAAILRYDAARILADNAKAGA